jgi:hypothetical protein
MPNSAGLSTLFNNLDWAVTARNLLARQIPVNPFKPEYRAGRWQMPPGSFRRHPRTFSGVLWDARKKKRLQKQAHKDYTSIDILTVATAVVQVLTRVYVA